MGWACPREGPALRPAAAPPPPGERRGAFPAQPAPRRWAAGRSTWAEGGGGAVPVLQRRFAVPARGGGGERREGRPERPLRRGRGVKTPTAALGGDAAPGLLKATPALAERGAGPGAARPSGWGEGGGGGEEGNPAGERAPWARGRRKAGLQGARVSAAVGGAGLVCLAPGGARGAEEAESGGRVSRPPRGRRRRRRPLPPAPAAAAHPPPRGLTGR